MLSFKFIQILWQLIEFFVNSLSMMVIKPRPYYAQFGKQQQMMTIAAFRNSQRPNFVQFLPFWSINSS